MATGSQNLTSYQANKLTNERELYVDLSTTRDSNNKILFDGTEDKILQISGILSTTHGGTGTNTNPDTWGIIYATSTTADNVTTYAYASTDAGTAGYLLQSNATSAPSWIQATDSNVVSTIVKRDSNGDFSAGIITADLSGNAATATRINGNLTAATTDVNRNIWVSSTASADGIPNYISDFNMNPSTKVFTVPSGTRISPSNGALYLGNSGNNSWVYVQDMASQDSSKWKLHQNGNAEFTGTVGTGAINANGDLNLYTNSADSPDIVWWYADKGTEQARLWMGSGFSSKAAPSFREYKSDGTSLYNGVLPLGDGTGASGTWEIDISGNAATATTLKTARSLWGNSFNGSANISGHIKLAASKHIYMTYNSTEYAVLYTHNNGNVSLRACGGGLYIGYENTTLINWINGKMTLDSSGNLAATKFTGAVVGNVTGDCSGSSGSCTGNAATATKLETAGTTAQFYRGDRTWSSTLTNILTLYREGTTAQDYPAGISLSNKDTTTGKTYNGAYVYAYQDHGATPYGQNLVINSGGNTVIGAGESAGSLYSAKLVGNGSENMYVLADGTTYIYANANTIANRIGFAVNTSGHILPQKAEAANNNAQNLGASNNKWANVYATTFTGNLTGDVTGDCSGSSGSCTGNAATATTATSLAGGLTTNDATSHGNLKVTTAKGSYYGINFGGNASGMSIMSINASHQGLYNQTNGQWILYYNAASSSKSIVIGSSTVNVTGGISLNLNTKVTGKLTVTSTMTANTFEANGNTYPTFRTTRTDSGETSMYFKNATAGWAMGINPWSVGAGVFGIGQYSGTGSSAWRFKIDNSGYCYASSRLYNAVWNDFAEFREGTTEEPGRVVAATANSNKVSPTTERLQPVAHVISDTYGSSVGNSDTAKTPLGVSGRVLVYPYQDKNNYHVGDCVCAAPGGTADIMTREEIIKYPDRIIGIVDEIPDYKIWNASLALTDEAKSETNIQVNGRIWIYVR